MDVQVVVCLTSLPPFRIVLHYATREANFQLDTVNQDAARTRPYQAQNNVATVQVLGLDPEILSRVLRKRH